ADGSWARRTPRTRRARRTNTTSSVFQTSRSVVAFFVFVVFFVAVVIEKPSARRAGGEPAGSRARGVGARRTLRTPRARRTNTTCLVFSTSRSVVAFFVFVVFFVAVVIEKPSARRASGEPAGQPRLAGGAVAEISSESGHVPLTGTDGRLVGARRLTSPRSWPSPNLRDPSSLPLSPRSPSQASRWEPKRTGSSP